MVSDVLIKRSSPVMKIAGLLFDEPLVIKMLNINLDATIFKIDRLYI